MEGRIPEQKMMIAGISHEKRLFPKVLLPTRQYINSDDQAGGIAAITQTILNNREWIEHQLMEHSALLFRGFPLRSAVDFRSFVEAFGWEEQPYLGFAPRPKVVDRVYTTNEAPLHKEIHFHHEMARVSSGPCPLFDIELERRCVRVIFHFVVIEVETNVLWFLLWLLSNLKLVETHVRWFLHCLISNF